MSFVLEMVMAAAADLQREIDREIIRSLHPDPPGWSAIRRGSGWDIDYSARPSHSTIGG